MCWGLGVGCGAPQSCGGQWEVGGLRPHRVVVLVQGEDRQGRDCGQQGRSPEWRRWRRARGAGDSLRDVLREASGRSSARLRWLGAPAPLG